MGEGPLTRVVKRHIASGLKVWATIEAALTVHDNLANGHGCAYGEKPTPKAFETLVLTGPRRSKFSISGAHTASPFGDMMLTGCFGLVKAFCWREDFDWP